MTARQEREWCALGDKLKAVLPDEYEKVVTSKTTAAGLEALDELFDVVQSLAMSNLEVTS